MMHVSPNAETSIILVAGETSLLPIINDGREHRALRHPRRPNNDRGRRLAADVMYTETDVVLLGPRNPGTILYYITTSPTRTTPAASRPPWRRRSTCHLRAVVNFQFLAGLRDVHGPCTHRIGRVLLFKFAKKGELYITVSDQVHWFYFRHGLSRHYHVTWAIEIRVNGLPTVWMMPISYLNVYWFQ
jgi:hypothetical protein